MRKTSLVEILTDDHDVLVDGGDRELAVAAPFEERLATLATVEEDALADEVASVTDDATRRDPLTSVATEDPSFVRRYVALREFAADLGHNEAIQSAFLVGGVIEGFPPTSGVPDRFLPIRGDQLETALSLYRRAIVYVWLEDCDPCDHVRADLEAAFDETPTEVALFAVYGPDWARFLEERLDVPGGPATLFVLNGEVDVRLYGAYGPSIIRRETEKLQELDEATEA